MSYTYRSASNVNNQIGYIHEIIKHLNPNIPKDVSKFNFEQIKDTSLNIQIVKNAIPLEIAEEVRSFVNSIPQHNMKILSDSNMPDNNVFLESTNETCVKQAYDNPVSDPDQWIWELYDLPGKLYRCSPLSLSSFIGSPIMKLMVYLEEKWKISEDVSSFIKYCVVLQKIEKDGYIPLHDDYCNGRMISFVYYLTPDDYGEEDGGELSIADGFACLLIKPEFNTLVKWNMVDDRSPYHRVLPVKSDKMRLALVGFWCRNAAEV